MRMLFTHALIVFVISAGFSFSQESRYQIIGGEDENFSWQEADAKAKTLSGHLATITSDEEMGIIARLLNDFERTTGIRPIPWIGGFEAGNPLEWRWVTGEPFTYTNWYIGLTTINPPGDDEIYLQTGSSGWQFYPQNRGRGRCDYFILEKPPVDTDGDGLSDGYEEVISKTDINNPDTDNDGLVDGDEVNTYRTNPNSPDSDSDGFTDLYELETAYDPNSAESVPDALVEIMTAIEVKFNAALGATYAIEFSTDNQAWDVIEDDIVGEGGAIERLYSKQEYPTGFFRVERKDE